MKDNIENLILEHLKAIRTELSGLKSDVRDVKMRLMSLESYQAVIHTDSVHRRARLGTLY